MSETITYGGVVFLCHKESCEVRKGKDDIILYYTRQDTGESGMSVRSLASACGIALLALQKLLDNPIIFEEVTTKTAKNKHISLDDKEKEVTTKPYDFYLIKTDDAHIIRDTYCERIIYYYSFESHYKKTKARELYQTLAQHGLRVFIHSKTGYQAELALQHDDSIRLSIEEQLKRKVEELELQLVKKEESIQERDANIKQLQCKVNVLEYVPHLEKTYQAYLHDSVGGTRELLVSGPYPGRVDIATEKLIIEVKRAVDFEKAFGQLLRYRAQLKDTIHANKTYTIFLFGNVTAAEREILECMAQMTNFQLMIYKDLKDYVDEDELEIRKKVIMAA